MSRELKFRVYDKEAGYYISILDNDCFSIEQLARIVSELRMVGHDFIIEQYTGLKDRNGKEIYEGDIVRYADDYEENAEVVFDDGGFQVEWPINIERLEGDITCMMEVIGNIHENPELIGGRE